MMNDMDEMDDDVLSETENFTVWRTREEDEFVYHIELGGVTLHLTSEEWDEFVVLMKGAG
ncbi:MAG: hypothetical protein KC425_21160 [Anaerolineales bacterium]|nr:hypothetical protein [Anaerolineales bacterium]